MKRNEITKDIIYKKIKEIYEINKDISCLKLFKLVSKELNCTINLIIHRYGKLKDILKEFNINIPKCYCTSEARKGRIENRKRKDINKEIVYKTVIEVYGENKDISINKLFRLVCKKLNCSETAVKTKCGSFDNILKELNINIPKNYTNFEDRKKTGKAIKNSKKWQKVMKSKEFSESVRKGQKNSEKWQKAVHSKEKGEKISKAVKKNISLDDIGQNMLNKFKYEGLFSANELKLDKHRNFSTTVFNRVLRENNTTIEDLAKQKGVKLLNRRIKWKQKEKVIEDVIREYEPNMKTQVHHPGIGRVDIETPNIIYDAKSYFYMGWQEQYDRYSLTNKEVKFIVFENKGKTDIPRERTVLLKELVKDLPNDKKLLISEKIERIKNNVPLEQMALKDFEEKEKGDKN